MIRALVVITILLAAWSPVEAQQDNTIGGVYIPAIQLVKPVQPIPLVDHDWNLDALGTGVAWLGGTAWIDDRWARIVLAGHTPGAFDDLVLLEQGDQVMVWDQHTVEVYAVAEMHIVGVSDTRWLLPTATETLTLITCAGKYRLIVHCTKMR